MSNFDINESVFERLNESSGSTGRFDLGRTEEPLGSVQGSGQDLVLSSLTIEAPTFTVSTFDNQASSQVSQVVQPQSQSGQSQAQNLAAVVSLSEFAAEWGFGEGVGTGDLSDVFAACGCGQCPTCGGNNSDSGYNNFGSPTAATTIASLDQVVFLDFDSGTNGSIDYTQDIRDQVQAQMALIYENFGVTFVQEIPTEGDFSTLVFNAGTPGGLAEDIDFRNLNKNDNAVINIEGFGLTNTTDQIINASANIGAHELGHLLGLRHHDAFGPIGSGVPSTLGFFSDNFLPAFPGLREADETRRHIINTPALAGDVTDVLQRNWLGEREAIKLAFAASGNVTVESLANNDTIEQAQALELGEIVVPNTIIVGENADAGDFLVDAISVVGSFTFVDPVDYYSFEGRTGLAYSFEAISNATNRYADFDPVDPIITIFDSDFNIVNYFGTDARNDDDIEGGLFDSHLFDLFLPEDGTYFVEVDTFSSGETGNYELFIQGFIASPFDLPLVDDHSDNLLLTEASQLVFDPVSNIQIAREDGVVGFADNPAERDVFTFTIDTSARAIINVSAQTEFFDAFVEVFDAGGNRIGFNDNHSNPSLQNPLDSQLILPDLAAGDYFVAVSGANGTNGEYRLGVRHNGTAGTPDDHGDSFPLASDLNLRALPNTTFVNSSVELGTDVDVFRFTAIATGRIVVRSLALTGDLNTVLRGFDVDQTLLDANNNFNGTLDSRLSFDTIAGDEYFVRLNSVGDSAGDYRLSFRTIPGESTPPGGFSPNGLALPTEQGSIDKYVDLNFGSNDTGAAFDSFLASSDISFGRIDDYDSSGSGILAGNA